MSEDLSSLINLEWLRACPTGILVLRGQRILWANPALARMTRLSPWVLADPDHPTHPTLRQLLDAEGLTVLSTGPGIRVWLFCKRAQFPSPAAERLELRYFQDVSGEVRAARERDTLAQKVQELSLTDSLTGLANRRALAHALNVQVSRSRRYHNPLSLALVRVEAPGMRMPLPDEAILAMSRFLRERLRWVDELGRHSGDTFLLILPETDVEAAQQLLEKIRTEASDLVPPSPHQGLALRFRIGVAQWHSGLDATRLLAVAEAGLNAPDTACTTTG